MSGDEYEQKCRIEYRAPSIIFCCWVQRMLATAWHGRISIRRIINLLLGMASF